MALKDRLSKRTFSFFDHIHHHSLHLPGIHSYINKSKHSLAGLSTSRPPKNTKAHMHLDNHVLWKLSCCWEHALILRSVCVHQHTSKMLITCDFTRNKRAHVPPAPSHLGFRWTEACSRACTTGTSPRHKAACHCPANVSASEL